MLGVYMISDRQIFNLEIKPLGCMIKLGKLYARLGLFLRI